MSCYNNIVNKKQKEQDMKKQQLRTFYVGKYVEYDNIPVGDYNVKNITLSKTYCAGPDKEDTIDMLTYLIGEWFSKEDVEPAKELLSKGKIFEKPENGYMFQIDEVMAPSIIEVL
jgi:hypothetical protein